MKPFINHIAVLFVSAVFSLSIVACGGGGGSGGSGGSGGGDNANAQSAVPYIFSTVSSFEAGKVPPGLMPSSSNTLISVTVLNDADGSVISNAIASANGLTLQYSALSHDYSSSLALDPGAVIEVRVVLNGKTYTASTTLFANYPALNAPVTNDWWYSGDLHQLNWSSMASDTESYAVGIMSAAGDVVWPVGGRFQIASLGTTQASVGNGALRAGDFYALVGQRKIVDFQGAASQSGMAVRSFSQAPISVFDSPVTLQSIDITAASQNIALNDSVQLTAIGTYSNNRTKDITNSVLWSTWDASTATVSGTGRVSAARIGQTKIQASITNPQVFNNMSVNVYREKSSSATSAAAPLSQAVAYQIDYAHSGAVSLRAPLSFPASATWSTALNGPTSYPLIADGKVFVVTGASAITSDRGASLYALNAQTGAILWGPVDIPGNSAYAEKWADHAYDNGTVFVLGSDGMLRSFNGNTGSPGWFVSTSVSASANIAAPVAKDGRVYVANEGGVRAYDQVNGDLLWSSWAIASAGATPAIADDGLLASAGCTVGKFDLRTGANLWTNQNGCSSGTSSPIAYANHTGVAAGFGANLMFNASTGAYMSGIYARVLPALGSTTAYTLNLGSLSAINMATEIGQWSFTGDGHLNSAPLLINNTVVVASESGNVYALNATTGAQIWVGNAGQPIRAPSFFDFYPTSGLAAGLGYLLVPAGNSVTAWRIAAP
jgi:outer membrane protein assembly factor BamB